MSEQEIKAGQIYRERDSRYVRYVRIDEVDGYVNGFVRCRTCREDGTVKEGLPRTRVRKSGLRERFVLASEPDALQPTTLNPESWVVS